MVALLPSLATILALSLRSTCPSVGKHRSQVFFRDGRRVGWRGWSVGRVVREREERILRDIDDPDIDAEVRTPDFRTIPS